MATDYDVSRKSEDEQKEESLEARRLTSGEQDKTSGKVDEDEAEVAETYELPGADLSHETLSIEVTPAAGQRVHLHQLLPRPARVPTVRTGLDLCLDCA